MNRILPAAITLLLAVHLPAQELPTHELPVPDEPVPELPQFIRLEPSELLGTWHGIDPNRGSFSAWEIHYQDDGTYQIRALRREFDLPADDGMDAEDLTDGTWKITEQGFLEFDNGDMLFQPVGRDQDKITYTASFPNEAGSVPWTVHEFRGPAPAVIFDLAPFTDKENAKPGPEQTQAINLRHLLLGCSVYAVDHGGQFPAKLTAIIDHIGKETLAEMKNFSDPETGKQRPWTLLPGRKIADPHDTVLIHSPEYGAGKRIVGLIDNSVLILDQAEFAEKMGQPSEPSE